MIVVCCENLHAQAGAAGEACCIMPVRRKGMDLYFERHDGQAVTCDDFRNAMADANSQDLSAFAAWWVAQAHLPLFYLVDWPVAYKSPTCAPSWPCLCRPHYGNISARPLLVLQVCPSRHANPQGSYGVQCSSADIYHHGLAEHAHHTRAGGEEPSAHPSGSGPAAEGRHRAPPHSAGGLAHVIFPQRFVRVPCNHWCWGWLLLARR